MPLDYSYELFPYPAINGGGWLLRLLLNGQELGQRVFPPSNNIENAQLASDTAHSEALSAVTDWLASIDNRDPCYRPRHTDDGDMYLLMPDDWLLVPDVGT